MKKISSFILTICFFVMLSLPSFYIPISKFQEKSSKEKELVYVETVVSPPNILLPEIEISETVKPKIIEKIVRVPMQNHKENTIKFLPMPELMKLKAKVQLLEVDKLKIAEIKDLPTETQDNFIYTAMWQ